MSEMTVCGMERAVMREMADQRRHERAGNPGNGMDDRTASIIIGRDQARKLRLHWLREKVLGRKSPAERARRAIENAWAMIWALGHCWVEMGETVGFWEVVRDEDQC